MQEFYLTIFDRKKYEKTMHHLLINYVLRIMIHVKYSDIR